MSRLTLWRHNVKLNPRWWRPSRQYFGFRSSRAATALYVSKKTLLFVLFKVSTFICKREILGCSSPLKRIKTQKTGRNPQIAFCPICHAPLVRIQILRTCVLSKKTTYTHSKIRSKIRRNKKRTYFGKRQCSRISWWIEPKEILDLAGENNKGCSSCKTAN